MDMFIKKNEKYENHFQVCVRDVLGRKNVVAHMKLNRINKLSMAASVVAWMIIGVSFILIIYYKKKKK